MATYKPVVVQAFPKLGERITQDTLYWRAYKVGVSPAGGGRSDPVTGRGVCALLPAGSASSCGLRLGAILKYRPET